MKTNENKARWRRFQELWPRQSRAERTAYLDARSSSDRAAVVDRWIRSARQCR
jgi:hypothetical protein